MVDCSKLVDRNSNNTVCHFEILREVVYIVAVRLFGYSSAFCSFLLPTASLTILLDDMTNPYSVLGLETTWQDLC